LYYFSNIIRMMKSRKMRWEGHVVHMEEMRNAFKILVGKPEVTIPLGRLRRKFKDSIKMGLKEIVCDVVAWIHPAEDINH
jgi:hypothetical protein